jgi:hypothetical protein
MSYVISFWFFRQIIYKSTEKIALTYEDYLQVFINPPGEFLACLVPDMNPTAWVAGERAARNGLVQIEIKIWRISNSEYGVDSRYLLLRLKFKQ